MSVTFAELNRCLPLVMTSKYPVLLRGRHGIGKSQVVYQYAEELNLPVVERRASQMTEGDLLGIPSPESENINGEQATKFRPFDWLVRACTEPCVLFFDEIDRAILEVRQGIFELTDSRKLAGWHLHPGTHIVAAINGGEDSGNYQVGEMDPAELDRWHASGHSEKGSLHEPAQRVRPSSSRMRRMCCGDVGVASHVRTWGVLVG